MKSLVFFSQGQCLHAILAIAFTPLFQQFAEAASISGIVWANIEHGNETPKLIQRCDPDGSNVTNFYLLGTNSTMNWGEDVLVNGQYVYFTDPTAGRIHRATLDGSSLSGTVGGGHWASDGIGF